MIIFYSFSCYSKPVCCYFFMKQLQKVALKQPEDEYIMLECLLLFKAIYLMANYTFYYFLCFKRALKSSAIHSFDYWKMKNNIYISDLTSICNFWHWSLIDMRHVSKNWKDGKASKDTGATVCNTHYNGVLVAVVVKLIVRGQSHQTTPGNRERKEDLSSCILPNLR